MNHGSTPAMGRVGLLRSDAKDPSVSFERRRHDVIDTRSQRNRNPFIDHPEWVGAILG